MNKSKITLAAIGGVTAAAAAFLGYMIFTAMSEKGEKAEELESSVGSLERLSRLPVRPCEEARRAVDSNRVAFVEWRTNALAAVSAGDRTYEPTTPPAFKAKLTGEAREFAKRPGTAEGRIVKKDFAFGVRDYILAGKLPSAEALPRLQREWGDIFGVLKILADAGALEICELELTSLRAGAAAAEAQQAANAKDQKRNKKKKKPSRAKKAAEPEEGRDATTFTVLFLATPESFVKAVNALSAAPRFTVVEDFSFSRQEDALAGALGAAVEGKAAEPAAGRRGRRGARQPAAAEAKPAEKKGGFVVDPMKMPPLRVAMRVSVYDFRTGGKTERTEPAEKAGTAEKTEEPK